MSQQKCIGPTPLQQQVLDVIGEWMIRHGVPPTIRELAAALGVASQACMDRIRLLERKGYLVREPGLKARGLRLVPRGATLTEAEAEAEAVRRLAALPADRARAVFFAAEEQRRKERAA